MKIDKTIETVIDTLELRQGKRSFAAGLSFGLDRLDQLTAGLQDGQLITFSGVCGSGKTAFALSVARHIAIEERKKVTIVCSNEDPLEMTAKLICCEARKDSSRIKSGFISRDDWNRLTDAAGLLTDCDIELIDKIDFDAPAASDTDLLIIDSFQRISVPAGANIHQEQISYDISNRLKNLAVKKNIPIVVLSSLNSWQIEKRSDKRPNLSDFKWGYSGLSDISDVVIALYRDEMYNRDENNPNRGTVEVIVLKNRTGPTSTAFLTFLEVYNRFENLADEPC